jgi:ABC-type methionine transport system permease subunit
MKMFIRKGFIRKGMALTASLVLAGMATSAQAADSVNVAFFLEWATPNQIAKVDKTYDEAMGVDVNWTDFSTGVQMTEAMLAGDIDIAYSQGLAPFVTLVQQGAPLILTIFGIQDDGKIFLLFMVAFAIMVISARTGASGTQLSKIRASHSLGATNGQILRHVILPNALPEILTGVRIAIGVCWGTLVAAEMLAGTTGIGFIENVARTVSDYELIWVTILIMGLLGLLFDLAMRWVIGQLIPWRGKG